MIAWELCLKMIEMWMMSVLMIAWELCLKMIEMWVMSGRYALLLF